MGTLNHPFASVGLIAERWWHIKGEDIGGNPVKNGFDLSMTLPYPEADMNSRVCKWSGSLGDMNWDCSNDSNTTFVSNSSVTRSNVTGFSDWAVGNTTPSAINLTNLTVQESNNHLAEMGLLGALMSGIGFLGARVYKRFQFRKPQDI